MRVGIFFHTIQIGKVGGVQQYIEQLIGGFSLHANSKMIIFCSAENVEHFSKYIPAEQKSQIVVIRSYIPGIRPKYINVCLKEVWLFLDKAKLGLLYTFCTWFFYRTPLKWVLYCLGDYRVWIEKYVDVVHFPYPYLNRYDLTIPTVVTMHDLQHKIFPSNFSDSSIRKHDKYYESSARQSTCIIVSYKHVKDDIVKYYNIPEEKIDVCREGQSIMESPDDIVGSQVIVNSGISSPYMIYPAAPSHHKNHTILIKAMDILQKRYAEHITLVITGNKYASNYLLEIEKIAQDTGLQEHVVFVGFVSNEELFGLMKQSDLVIIPTLYEAGSLPLDEAMSLGVPVLCSNVTALPEQIGDERFVFDPLDEQDVAEKIHRMLHDEVFRAENIQNSAKQKRDLDWRTRVVAFENAYKQAFETRIV